MSLGFTASYISISKKMGPLSKVPIYDDCAYTGKGMQFLYDLKHGGVRNFVRSVLELRPHAPILELQAMLGFQLLGMDDDASPYWLNVFVLFAYLAVLAWLMCSMPMLPWLAITFVCVSLPIAKMAVVEYRPDIFWAICVSFGMFVMFTGRGWLSTRSTPFAAGVAFALALFGKPSAFPMTLVLLFAAVVSRMFYAKLFEAELLSLASLWRIVVWFAGPIIIIDGWFYTIFGRGFWNYFYGHAFGSSAYLWAFHGSLKDQLLYYITGYGGLCNMGRIGALLAIFTGILLLWRWSTGPWAARVRGGLLFGLLALIYLANTSGTAKQPFIGAAIYTMLIFLCAWLLAEFYATYREVRLAKGIVTLGLIIFAAAVPISLNEWPRYSDRRGPDYYSVPTLAMVEELKGLNPCPVKILWVAGGPISPPTIAMWMLRNSIRPEFLYIQGITGVDGPFQDIKKRADLVMIPLDTYFTREIATKWYPNLSQDLIEDPEFRLLRVVSTDYGTIHFFIRSSFSPSAKAH